MSHARFCFLIPLATALIGLASLIVVGIGGWPGEVGSARLGFCEASRPGIIKQPVNTWSNAGFLLVGIWAGWQAWRDVNAKKSPAWTNRLVSTVHYPVGLATCSVLIGLGSAALHASTTRWGAELDHLFMHIWGTWCLAFASARLLRATDRDFYRIWLTLIGGVLVRIAWGKPYAISGAALFGILIALTVLVEVIGRWRNRHLIRLDSANLVWAVVIFLAADACRVLSKDAGPLCDPHSFWQGHAAWHLLCAGSTGFVYLYGRSERIVNPG